MPTRTTILCLALSLCAVGPAHARAPLEPGRGVVTPAREPSRLMHALPANPGESIAGAIARLPRSVELVLIINDARHMFDSSVGLSTWGLVTDLTNFGVGNAVEMQKSWDELSSQLGWAKPETLDRLIGSRLTLVMRDVDKDESRRWAVVSDISEQTDRQLKDRLRPARRNIVDGHPILAIEQGKYEVTSHLNTPGPVRDDANNAQAPADARSVSLLLTDAGKTDLFDELISLFSRRPPETLANTQVPKEAEKLGRADIFMAVRIDPQDAANQNPADAWRNFLLIAARRTPTGWECSVVVRDSEHEQQLAQIPRTSDAPLHAIAKDAMVAVLETRLKSLQANPSNPIERLFAMLGLPEGVQNLLSGRQLLAIRSTSPDIAAPPPGAAAPVARLSVAIGAETSDVLALAPLGDAFMDDALGVIEDKVRLPTPDARPNMNLGGVACAAFRTSMLNIPMGHPLARFFDVPLRFAWTFTTPEPAQLHRVGMPEDHKNQQKKVPPGWWLVNVGQPDSLAAISRSLRDPEPGGELRPWYSLGVIRPVRCVPFFNNIVPDLGGLQAAFGRIESIQWKLAVSPDKDVEGSVSIEMTRPK